jgi:hypothetical protein
MGRTRSILAALLVVGAVTPAADAGWLFGRRQERATVGRPGGPVMTNVPRWAAEKLAKAPPGSYTVPANSRRPWASALNQIDTPANRMARYRELGGAAGPMPGYTNEPFHFAGPATMNYPIP